MNTKKKILDAALSLFSEKGYADVYVSQIAEAVGIKAPSIYKHYKSKKEIFNAILDEMKNNYVKMASSLDISGDNAAGDAAFYMKASGEQIMETGMALLTYFLHDEYACKFRKMLTVGQFHDKELARLFSSQYADAPLAYQSAMFAMLSAHGQLKNEAPDVMALHFYAPLFMIMTMYDREPEREQELLQLARRHISQFIRIYTKEEDHEDNCDTRTEP